MTSFRSLLSASMMALTVLGVAACGELEMPAAVDGFPSRPTRVTSGAFSLKGYDASQGHRLAQTAAQGISGGTGLCYQYVACAIHQHYRPFLSGRHAWMAADQLATHPGFREIIVTPSDLPRLPAGAVVVWSQGRSPSGHISIADGQGQEISDHKTAQLTRHYGGGQPRVFIPVRSKQ